MSWYGAGNPALDPYGLDASGAGSIGSIGSVYGAAGGVGRCVTAALARTTLLYFKRRVCLCVLLGLRCGVVVRCQLQDWNAAVRV